ncbi:hypothetical protein H7I53_13705 [Mycolicibacterium pulveris]|uniref:hypothetical protein n=1 Tax=Mycolicibacterium pulveris TaxID=36813 RepID=UPI0013D1B834|nr:hypothetical protein [Mycolicibacterium pulveris]MCV6981278.1 hypothetical protein [Mycolicibacterium pulveris]
MTAYLGFGSAACGLVAVLAMIQQQITGGRLEQRLGDRLIIDGGTVSGENRETPQHLEVIMREMAANQRPGCVAIVFACLGAVLALAAGVLGLIGS